MRLKCLKTHKLNIIVCILTMLGLVSCNMNSSVDFKGAREDIFLGKTMPYASLNSHQGGVVNGQTTSGYKVNISLGVQPNLLQTATASGYDVRLNFVGQTSQSTGK